MILKLIIFTNVLGFTYSIHFASTSLLPLGDKSCATRHAPTRHAPTRHAPTRHAPTRHAPTRHAPTPKEQKF